MIRTFELHNNGSLDIERVYLDTEYTVDDVKGNNTEDFGEHIEVEFLYNVDKLDEVIYQTTLAELQDMTPEAAGEHVLDPILGGGYWLSIADSLSQQWLKTTHKWLISSAIINWWIVMMT